MKQWSSSIYLVTTILFFMILANSPQCAGRKAAKAGEQICDKGKEHGQSQKVNDYTWHTHGSMYVRAAPAFACEQQQFEDLLLDFCRIFPIVNQTDMVCRYSGCPWHCLRTHIHGSSKINLVGQELTSVCLPLLAGLIWEAGLQDVFFSYQSVEGPPTKITAPQTSALGA